MTNIEKLAALVPTLSEELAAEILDFAEFVRLRSGERQRQAFEDWQRSCPVDEEAISPELAARLAEAEAAYTRGEFVPADELKSELGLS